MAINKIQHNLMWSRAQVGIATKS